MQVYLAGIIGLLGVVCIIAASQSRGYQLYAVLTGTDLRTVKVKPIGKQNPPAGGGK